MTDDEIREGIAQHQWWHTIELAPGITTPGKAHNRALIRYLDIPDDLTGMTVLDIGAWDGYYSFECEKRGAARVVAVDVWETAGRDAFNFAHHVLKSAVEPVQASVHDLTPGLLGGRFDLVLFLGVLYHLKNPFDGIEKVAGVTAPGGVTAVETVIDRDAMFDRPLMSFYPGSEMNNDPTNWWAPNPSAVIYMLGIAGYRTVINTVQLCFGNRSIFHAVKDTDEGITRRVEEDHAARYSWAEPPA